MRHYISPLYRKRLIDSDDSDFIRIHTVQNLLAWENIHTRGYISPPPHIIEDDEYTVKEYNWMREHMSSRLESFSGDYPVWARTKKISTRKPLNWTHDNGQKYVYISAIVPKKRILPSSFSMYEMMMGNCPCLLSEIPDEEFFSMPDDKIRETWPLMFDISITGTDYTGLLNDIQLCIDRLYKEEIYKVRMIKNPNHRSNEILFFNRAVLSCGKIIGVK